MNIRYTMRRTYTARKTNQGGEEGQRGNRNTFITPDMKCVNDAHTHEPCIMASQALLLCNVLMKRARFGSVASAFAAPAVPVTADSCGYACGVWSSVGGGVASLGDGVGDGDNDSEGVEPLECYSRGKTRHKRKEHVLVIPRMRSKRRPGQLRYGRWRGCERTVKFGREGPYSCVCVCGCGWG
jgi:hypothetical protein